jgi:hypothetical protein
LLLPIDIGLYIYEREEVRTMCESRRVCCCDGFRFEVKPTEKGFKIDVAAKDDEMRKTPKRIVICCCEAPKDSAADKCCT